MHVSESLERIWKITGVDSYLGATSRLECRVTKVAYLLHPVSGEGTMYFITNFDASLKSILVVVADEAWELV